MEIENIGFPKARKQKDTIMYQSFFTELKI